MTRLTEDMGSNEDSMMVGASETSSQFGQDCIPNNMGTEANKSTSSKSHTKEDNLDKTAPNQADSKNEEGNIKERRDEEERTDNPEDDEDFERLFQGKIQKEDFETIAALKEKYCAEKGQTKIQIFLGSNVVENSGFMHGNIHQTEQAEDKNRNHSARLQLDLEHLSAYLKKQENFDESVILIVLVLLRILPDSSIFAISNQLLEQLSKGSTEESEVTFHSVEEVAEKFQLEFGMVKVQSVTGQISVSCLIWEKEELAKEVTTYCWRNYPEMRHGIVEWLIELRDFQQNRSLLLYQIHEALQELASLDFDYTYHSILPFLFKVQNWDNYNSLIHVIQGLMDTENYRHNTQTLLGNWCSENGWLWKVAYFFYKQESTWNWQNLLKRRLKKEIQRELERGTPYRNDNSKYYFPPVDAIPIGILQDEKDMASLYLEVLSEEFQLSERTKDKERFACYICRLFWKDFMEEGWPTNRMMFLDSCNSKKDRKAIKPFLRFIWQRKRYRDMISKLLIVYMNSLTKRNLSWDYTKEFWKLVAFTGEEADFQNTIHFLERAEIQYEDSQQYTQVQEYLRQLLERRRKESIKSV